MSKSSKSAKSSKKVKVVVVDKSKKNTHWLEGRSSDSELGF